MADSTALYSTIATVLPLFALTLLAERRFGAHGDGSDPTTSAVIAIALLAAAAIGELAAFDALANHPTRSDRVAAELGLGFAGVFLFGDLVWAQVAAHRERSDSKLYRGIVMTLAAVATSAAGVLLVLYVLASYT